MMLSSTPLPWGSCPETDRQHLCTVQPEAGTPLALEFRYFVAAATGVSESQGLSIAVLYLRYRKPETILSR
jgi:hypothetical protein